MTDNPPSGGEATPTPQELRALLREKGITIKEFSSILGYSYNHTSGILSGRSKMPQGFPVRFHEAVKLCQDNKRAGMPVSTPDIMTLARKCCKVPVILTASEITSILGYFGGKENECKAEDLPAFVKIIVNEWMQAKSDAGILPFGGEVVTAPKITPRKTDNPAGR